MTTLEVEDNEAGGQQLSDGENAWPLTPEEIDALRTGNKASVRQLVDGKLQKTGAGATDDELDAVRKQVGGAPFLDTRKVTKVGQVE